jgi:hypothetical protein
MHPWVYFRIGPEAQDVNEADTETRRSGKGSREWYLEAEQPEVNGVKGDKREVGIAGHTPSPDWRRGSSGFKNEGGKTTRVLRRRLQ